MGRNPKIRINFDSDVQFLLRLKHAVEEDREYPQEFRNEAVSRIGSLIHTLMSAPQRGVVVEAPPKAKRKEKKRAA